MATTRDYCCRILSPFSEVNSENISAICVQVVTVLVEVNSTRKARKLLRDATTGSSPGAGHVKKVLSQERFTAKKISTSERCTFAPRAGRRPIFIVGADLYNSTEISGAKVLKGKGRIYIYCENPLLTMKAGWPILDNIVSYSLAPTRLWCVVVRSQYITTWKLASSGSINEGLTVHSFGNQVVFQQIPRQRHKGARKYGRRRKNNFTYPASRAKEM